MTAQHMQTNTIPNRRICLKLLSMLFNDLNSIMKILIGYLLISLPPMLPMAAPAVPAATEPVRAAAWLTFLP